jgi:hypothetical protein
MRREHFFRLAVAAIVCWGLTAATCLGISRQTLGINRQNELPPACSLRDTGHSFAHLSSTSCGLPKVAKDTSKDSEVLGN